LAAHLFDDETFTYGRFGNMTLFNIASVASVHMADFNVDGHVDILVVSASDDAAPLLQIDIYLQNTDALAFDAPYTIDSVASQVSIVDANFDLMPDLIAVDGNTTVVWLNGPTSSDALDANNTRSVTFERVVLKDALPLAPLHSVLYGDINGDCLADVLLPTHEGGDLCGAPDVCYQMFLAENGSLALNANLTLRLLAAYDATLLDVNGDGSLDLVYSISGAETDSVVVRFNARVTDVSATTLCQVHEVAFAVSDRSDILVRSRVQLNGAIAPPLANAPLTLTRTLRFGDIDRDGYPDMLVPILTTGGARKVQLWRNVPCLNATLCGSSASESVERRGFVRVSGAQVAALDDAIDIMTASFVDLGDKGSLDILLNFAAADGTVHATTLFNNLERSKFFLYLTSTNGVCRQWCSSPSPTFVNPAPVGAALAGVTYRFAYVSLHGDRVRRTASQLVRTTFCALDLPYEVIGLGTADNQVDQFVLAPPYARDGVPMQRLFDQGVFPQSTVYGWPTPRDDPTAWMLEQRLRYGDATFWVLVTAVAATALLGGVIGYFVWKENEQDSRERATSAQVYSISTF
jgi:hypothetical protein